MPRTTDSKLQALAEHPLFERCSARDLLAIGRVTELATVDADITLTVAGTEGRWVHLLSQGVAEVRRDGRVERLAGAGDAIGLAAALARSPHPATVVTRSPVSAFVLRASTIRDLVERLPAVASAAARSLSQQVLVLDAVTAAPARARTLALA